jgi:MinD-like ATPase involved in chromosome partitioning or flagellar assembly
MSRVVSFYSFKGGVGRSLLLANVAISLAERDLRVMCVDFDLTSGGLHNFFGVANNQLENTLLDLFDQLSPEDVGSVAIDVTETVGVSSRTGKVWLLPTLAEPAKLSVTFDVQDIGARFALIVDEVANLFNPDFILIDCPSGFSELASGPILEADYLICVLRPNTQNSEGIRMLLDILSTVGNSPAVLLALNQIPSAEELNLIQGMQDELGATWSFTAVVPYIPEAVDINGMALNIIRGQKLTEYMQPIVARLQGSAK